jgi:hypothetical protein
VVVVVVVIDVKWVLVSFISMFPYLPTSFYLEPRRLVNGLWAVEWARSRWV